MTETQYLIGVSTSGSPLIYYTSSFPLELGTKVVVDTPNIGTTIGTVQNNKKSEITEGFLPITRIATKDDLVIFEKNSKIEKDIFNVVTLGAKLYNLNMKIISTIVSLDFSKLLVIYSSDDRVDFRELVKELHRTFRTHIEMKQIGTRDRAQIIGGIGVCGLPLCCSTFIKNFDIISINMAKNQMLSLNIPKLSGQCGKLICCLKFEDENYTELKKHSPKINETYKYKNSIYKVTSVNLFTGMITLSNGTEFVTLTKQELRKVPRVTNER